MFTIDEKRKHTTITNKRITLSIVAFSLSAFIVIGAGLAPNAAFAERIPFAIQNTTQSFPAPGAFEEYFQIAILLPARNDSKF
jgi:hypothetical protein